MYKVHNWRFWGPKQKRMGLAPAWHISPISFVASAGKFIHIFAVFRNFEKCYTYANFVTKYIFEFLYFIIYCLGFFLISFFLHFFFVFSFIFLSFILANYNTHFVFTYFEISKILSLIFILLFLLWSLYFIVLIFW